MDKARTIALKTLYEIDKNKAYSNIALDKQLKENKDKINDKDIGLISEIVYGVTTWRLTLDEIIKKYSKIRLKKISPWIINILRMGTYQIIFLDKIPKSAAVNESVNLAKRYGHKASSNFVNAILRKVEKTDYEKLCASQSKLQQEPRTNQGPKANQEQEKNQQRNNPQTLQNEIKRISISTSMPEWIIKKLLEEKEINEVEKICKFSNEKAKISIRINRLKTTKIKIEEILKNEKIEFEQGLLKDFLYINKVKNIEKLESFKKGLFTIQEEVASLPCLILEPKENEVILDACSAPGGKTTYIAELINNKGKIEAWDIYEHRTKLIEENAKRLGITCIDVKIKDASKAHDNPHNSVPYNNAPHDNPHNNAPHNNKQFDKILLDVPCLGLGVIKRKPDIKWQKEEKDIAEITKTQMQILETCSKYLKKGGTLIYSTCSILKEENDEIIEKFLQSNKNFTQEKIKLTNYFKKYINKNGNLAVYPDKKTDGFFVAKLRKN